MAATIGKKSRSAVRPVLVCPDKFRGTFTAAEVAAVVVEALAAHRIAADVCAIADGGEGTLAVVTGAVDHELARVPAVDAHGRPLEAPVALLRDGRSALVEAAAIIGHAQVADAEPDPWGASSRGVGMAIAGATELGASEVFVGIGGTVSTDGGRGALAAMRESGWRVDGASPPAGGGRSRSLHPKLVALCDARVAWEQAATVFAPQKGADAATVTRLARRLSRLAGGLGRDPRTQVMAGAGGGLAGGLWAGAGAELRGGAAWVLDLLGYTPRMLAARAVITGEGRLDRQTLLGKAVAEVATRARQAGVPCHAIAGANAISDFDLRILDFESVSEADDAKAMARAVEGIAGRLATR